MRELPLPEPFQVLGRGILRTVDDPQIFSPQALDDPLEKDAPGRLNRPGVNIMVRGGGQIMDLLNLKVQGLGIQEVRRIMTLPTDVFGTFRETRCLNKEESKMC